MKKVLVTGAAGGIGSKVVEALLAESDLVIATDQNQADGLWSKSAKLKFHSCNLVNSSELEKLAQLCIDHKINSIVHCAGYGGPFVNLVETSVEDWKKIFAVNVDSLFFLAKKILPQCVSEKFGRIVAISSIQGSFGSTGSTAYVSSKHALNGLIKNIATEYGAYGITANGICPGYIKTAMGADDTKLSDYQSKVIARTPSKMLGEVDHVVSALKFLMADNNTYTNGTLLTVDGGISSNLGIV